MSQSKSLNIGIVCGEHSGDMLGAGIIDEIKKNSNIKLFGVGGPKLEQLGLKSNFDFSELQIMGLIDPLLNILENGQTPADDLLQKFNGSWEKDIYKIFTISN